jgi:pseudouridine synthase
MEVKAEGESYRYLLLNKPAGCICSRQVATGRDTPTVYSHLEAAGFPTDVGHVGRLDVPTEGLLLFTDDGLLLQALTNHNPTTRDGQLPAWAQHGEGAPEVVKVYHCEIVGRQPSEADLELMRQPYTYGKGRGAQRPADKQVTTLPADVRVVDPAPAAASNDSTSTWVEVRIMEGRNRQVRRLCQRSRLALRTLRRVALGPIDLGALPAGGVRWLTPAEVTAACNACLPGRPVPRILTCAAGHAVEHRHPSDTELMLDTDATRSDNSPRKRANVAATTSSDA